MFKDIFYLNVIDVYKDINHLIDIVYLDIAHNLMTVFAKYVVMVIRKLMIHVKLNIV